MLKVLPTEVAKMGRDTLIHTHTHPFNGPLSGTTQVSCYQKGKNQSWISLEQDPVSGSCISWDICKSAPRSRQITTPAPHYSSFFTGRMPFLSPNQQCQSSEGNPIHTHPFNGPFSRTTRVGQYQKGKNQSWILLKQVPVSGSGISWAYASLHLAPDRITTPAPHYSFFYRPDALPVAQPTVSKQ